MHSTSPDVLIRGARVVDGTGNPWFYGDIALQGDRIAAVEPIGLIPEDGTREVVDATGMVVCPGFIDIQSHSIVSLMVDAHCLSKITQGVTTEIMGEGWTPAPVGGRIEGSMSDVGAGFDLDEWRARARSWSRFAHWLEAMEERGVAPNVGSFLGGGTIREYVRGMDMGSSSPEERDQLRRVMTDAMEDGAFGVSYALIYPPDGYSDTDEIVSVAEVVARYGGVYITHIRSESAAFLEALDEALAIGRRSGAPVEIYHLKAAGRANWNKMEDAIARINAARADGVDVTADMYPYVGSGTGLSAIFPTWVAEGGKFYENLRDPAIRARVREETLHPTGGWEAMAHEAGPQGVMPVGFERRENKQYTGKRLSEIAEMRGQEWVDAAIDLLISEEQRIGTIYFSMNEENVRRQMTEPWIKFSTDAGGVDPVWAMERGPTHPRAYGTYPRVLGNYVREEGILPLEDAIRKMSGAVADRLSLRDRGQLRAGFYADVVIFDPETIVDRATFEDSHQLSTGIRDVWVNGTRVLRDGAHTDATPGRFLRGPGGR